MTPHTILQLWYYSERPLKCIRWEILPSLQIGKMISLRCPISVEHYPQILLYIRVLLLSQGYGVAIVELLMPQQKYLNKIRKGSCIRRAWVPMFRLGLANLGFSGLSGISLPRCIFNRSPRSCTTRGLHCIWSSLFLTDWMDIDSWEERKLLSALRLRLRLFCTVNKI